MEEERRERTTTKATHNTEMRCMSATKTKFSTPPYEMMDKERERQKQKTKTEKKDTHTHAHTMSEVVARPGEAHTHTHTHTNHEPKKTKQ